MKTLIISASDLFVIHLAKTTFESWSWQTMIYVVPLLGVIGNQPVCSVNILPVTFIVLTSIFFDQLFLFVVAIGVSGGVVSFGFVKRIFCLN